MTFFRFLAVLCLVHLLTPAPALAYVDPVTGSVMLQVLIAGLLGSLLAFRRAGFAIKTALSRIWHRLTG